MLSNLSVRKPYTIIVCALLVIVLGVISFTSMTTDLLPSMELPYVIVITTYPGASPEKVELAVTKPLESSLSTVGGIEAINSVSQENQSMIICQFTQGTNMDSAIIEMNSYVDLVRGYMPDEASSPMMIKMNPDMLPVMIAGVSGENMTLQELSNLVSDKVQPALERVDGVASVSVSGLYEENIRVTLEQDKIDALNDKLLRSINEELAEKQQELDDARAEIEDGKKELEDNRSEQLEKIAQGSAALIDGKLQIIQGLEKLKTSKTEAESQLKKLLEQKGTLTSSKTDYYKLTDGLKQMEVAIGQLPSNMNTASRIQSTLTQLRTMQNNLTAAQTAVTTLETKKVEAETGLTTVTATIEQLKPTVNVPEYQSAKSDYLAAVQAVTEAETVCTNASTALENDPTNEGLKTAFEQAKSNLEEAETTAAEKKQAYDYFSDLIAADAQLTAAQQMKTQLDQGLAQIEAQLPAANAALASAKQPVDMMGGVDKLAASITQGEQGLTLLESYDELKKTKTGVDTQLATQYATLAQSLASLSDASFPSASSLTPIEQFVYMEQMLATATEALSKALDVDLPAAEAELNEAQEKADKSSLALNEGQTTLAIELSKAEIMLEQGDKELTKGEEAFEEARDEALKNAGFDGVITKDMIAQILLAQNFSMPAGYIMEGEDEFGVKVGDELADVDAVQNLMLFASGVDEIGDIHLRDVATVAYDNNQSEIFTKINGENAVMMTIQKQSISSTAAVCEQLRKVSEELSAENAGLKIVALQDQGVYINMITGSVIENLLMGGLLAILILLLFLRDIKPTLIIATSIPLSLMFALVLMYFSGVTLNIISLSGLALGVGMLVDNSIVTIENIYRLRRLGVEPKEAAMEGAKQITGALVASTLTTVCVFLPIVFTEGLSKQLFTDMGLTIAYSLMASLLVALTLVPTMASGMLKNIKQEKEKSWVNRLINTYARSLERVLRHKGILVTLVGVLFVGSVVSCLFIGTGLFPPMSGTQVSITLEYPKEATTQEMREIGATFCERVLTLEDVTDVGISDSGSSLSLLSGGTSDHSYSAYALLKDEPKMTSTQLKDSITAMAEGLNVEVTANTETMDLSALSGGEGVSLRIRGDDLDTMRAISEDLMTMLGSVEGVDSVDNGLGESPEEVRISVNKNKAMEYGLTTAQVYQAVAAALTSESTATTLTIDGTNYDILVCDPADAPDRANIGTLELDGKKDDEEVTVTLKQIATIEETQGYSAIRRDGQSRYITVTATVDEAHNVGLVTRDAEEVLADYTLPTGYTMEYIGENETINSAISDLLFMLALAVLLIYMIMTAQFQSLLSPFIVMFTIPLAFTGGIISLWIFGFELSIVSMIGFLILAGIIVNNGIVYVDCVNQLVAGGLSKHEALLETARMRLRPILMTALTTILGLSTMALGFGQGAAMVQPMAVVTISGMIYATFLTLYLVPAMYDLLHKEEKTAVPAKGAEQ